MSENQFITITRDLVRRGWSDIEPKISVGLISGTFATAVVNFLIPITAAYGFKVPDSAWTSIPFIFAMLGGYIAPSAGTTVTKNVTTNDSVRSSSETHSGAAVSTITSPTKIQAVPAPVPNAATGGGKYDDFLAGLSADSPLHSGPQAVPNPDAPTQVIR